MVSQCIAASVWLEAVTEMWHVVHVAQPEKNYFFTYFFAAVCRTRDPGELAKCDVVVDVGAVYNPENHRYDHHQR